MEQQLDATYLRPSFVSKTLALGVAAIATGAAIMLATFGISFLWRPLPAEIDLRIKNPELTVTQSAPFVFATPIAHQNPNNVATPLAQQSTMQPAEEKQTTDVIQQEVVVFLNVSHEGGAVVTGWRFPNGNGRTPSGQYCYFVAKNGDRSSTRVDLAVDRKPVSDAGSPFVPNIDKALSKCQWWGA
jgi:hypothetical protein